jgi:hypothetical protein
VPNGNQVAELRTRRNARPTQRRPIDRAIRADLDIVTDLHNADLRDLHPLAAHRGIPQPIITNDRAGVNRNPVTYDRALIDDDVGIQQQVLANTTLGSNIAPGVYHGFGADHDLIGDRHARVNRRALTYARARRYVGRRSVLWQLRVAPVPMQLDHQRRDRRVGIRDANETKPVRRIHLRAQHHGRGPGRTQRLLVLRIGQEGYVALARILQGGDAVDHSIRVAGQGRFKAVAPKCFADLG